LTGNSDRCTREASRRHRVITSRPRLSDLDVYLFRQGTHYQLGDRLGSYIGTVEGEVGTFFSVWAPNAESVSVIGDFNGWQPRAHPLAPRWDSSGIWEGFITGVAQGTRYKYHIASRLDGYTVDKGDPFARYWEIPPRTASVVRDLHYQWGDGEWMHNRLSRNAHSAPVSIYEMHLGSWCRVAEENWRSPGYRGLAEPLTDYLLETGFTHVEFLPVMEHPFYGSWGYQTEGYFAPTSRYGTPEDLMFLIDSLHRNGIGVILDWVPSHFPNDEYGLGFFDGTHLYEHADPARGFHPEWKSNIFNYGRYEVQAFLISSALFWLEHYHADGLRVDGVASMLYLDYGRKEGEWIPNSDGGRENYEAMDFLRNLNRACYERHPDIMMIAEESTAWPQVTKPPYTGGLGFGMKWNMGWMHDTLEFFKKDPVHRKYHQGDLTFSLCYAFSENFVLPLSHDEVVHGKGSLLSRMPGDEWQKRANLRLLLGYMYTHPGKKLLFMGQEFGQWREWDQDASIDWHLLDHPGHRGVWRWVKDLNRLYRQDPSLHENDFSDRGFEWVDCGDRENGVISYLRKGDASSPLLAIANLTPVPRQGYRIGVPLAGVWEELLNSDATVYGGSGWGNQGRATTVEAACHGRPCALDLDLPPLSVLVFRHKGELR
jgi:1,4-alpha-glucan branching enzyme